MARRRNYRGPQTLEDALAPLFGLMGLGLVGYVVTHRETVMRWGISILGVCAVAAVVWIVWKKRRRNPALTWDDDKILYMLKGMSPSEFEREMARMFSALGYEAETVGGANDGGIDVVAYEGGKRYYIQCKKFMTREVTPHDVRDFLGAITNVNNPAEKGCFITTNKFTLAAERTAAGNPRLELIDGNRLVEYYKLAYRKNVPAASLTPPARSEEGSAISPEPGPNTCPECGNRLTQRKSRFGEFLGCTNFPKCKYTRNL